MLNVTFRCVGLGFIVAFVAALFVGVFYVSPEQIAAKYSVTFLISSAFAASRMVNNQKMKFVYGLLGIVGSVLGWLCYPGIVLG